MNPSIPTNPLPAAPHGGWRVLLRRAMLCGSAIAAAGLMLAYVQVCHAAVARGERFRAEQRVQPEPTPTVNRLAHRP